MNIDKYKQQHVEILNSITELRALSRSGVAINAKAIAALIISMSSTIRLHLTVEDRALYPALRVGKDETLARLGQKFQEEMKGIAEEYQSFSRRWNTPEALQQNPDKFRTEANAVLKTLYERMRREDTQFYPLIEANA